MRLKTVRKAVDASGLAVRTQASSTPLPRSAPFLAERTVMRLDSAQHRYVKRSLPNEVIRRCRIPLVGVAESTSLY